MLIRSWIKKWDSVTFNRFQYEKSHSSRMHARVFINENYSNNAYFTDKSFFLHMNA